MRPETTFGIDTTPLLEKYYDLPLSTDLDLNPHLKEVLRHGVRKAFTFQVGNSHSLLSVCPSPDHTSPSHALYSQPMVERFEWVGMIGGVEVGSTKDALVPIKWRGCRVDCLDHLSEVDTSNDEASGFKAGSGLDGEEFEWSDDD